MNNPTDQNFGSVVSTNPTMSGGNDLQQMGTAQSGYINQFMNDTQSTSNLSPTPPQSVTQGRTQQPIPASAVSSVSSNRTDANVNTASSLPPLPDYTQPASTMNPVVPTYQAQTPMQGPVANPSPVYNSTLPQTQTPTYSPALVPNQTQTTDSSSLQNLGVATPSSQSHDVGMQGMSVPNPAQVSPPTINQTSPVSGQTVYTTPTSTPTPTIPVDPVNQSNPIQKETLVSYEPVSSEFLDRNQQTNGSDLSSLNPSVGVQSPVVEQPVTPVQPPAPEDSTVIGTHQVTINEDYAENFNPNLQVAQSHQQHTTQPIRPGGIDFSKPSTITTVNQNFADGSQMSGDNFASTGFLPISDDGLLGDDDSDDPLEDDDQGDLSFTPYGFSDFDPNEQATMQSDLGGFESQSLEEVADNIDVDFSEHLPTQNTQGVGVLVQQPVNQNLQPIQNIQGGYGSGMQLVYDNKIEPINHIEPVNQIEPMAQSYFQNQTQNIQEESGYTQNKTQQIEPTYVQEASPVKVNAELSPAAKLNQLLEAEEAAERVIIQKQNQMINQSPKPKAVQIGKESIFKQLDPDSSLQGDIRNGMSIKKPSSRYFLIISLVIIISVIGFLLVLLGLTLL